MSNYFVQKHKVCGKFCFAIDSTSCSVVHFYLDSSVLCHSRFFGSVGLHPEGQRLNSISSASILYYIRNTTSDSLA